MTNGSEPQPGLARANRGELASPLAGLVQRGLRQAENLTEMIATGAALSLHDAARKGDMARLRFLLSRGCDVNGLEDTGYRPLHWAVVCHHLEAALLLLDNGADIDATIGPYRRTNTSGVYFQRDPDTAATALQMAAYERDCKILKALLERGADPDVRNRDGQTALYFAARQKCLEACQILVEHGADPNIADSSGKTLLHHEARRGRLDVFVILLKHGADINVADSSGKTPLFLAAMEGHSSIAESLLKAGAAVDLEAAILLGLEELVGSILAASPDAVNRRSGRPLWCAVCRGDSKMIRFLLNHGADPNLEDTERVSALYEAWDRDNFAAIDILLEHGVDANTRWGDEEDSDTLLHLAVVRKHDDAVSVVGQLIRRGADIDARGTDGETPLHKAIFAGNLEVARLLLASGARTDLPDYNEQTVLEYLEYVEEEEKPDFVALLQEYENRPGGSRMR